MPRNFSTVLFWFDGAFTNSLSSQIVELLHPDVSSAEKLAFQQKVRPLQEKLTIGKLDMETFCREAVEVCQSDYDQTRIALNLTESAELNTAFYDIYRHITPDFDPRVIVDIPENLFRQYIHRWHVEEGFPDGRLIFLERSGLDNLIPDVFQFIPKAASKKMDDCFVIDPLQMRAVASHKVGLVSTAFVYPRRMKIDLALQGIWKTSEDVYHPKAGARTKI